MMGVTVGILLRWWWLGASRDRTWCRPSAAVN